MDTQSKSHTSFLTRAFPVPRYLKMPAVGIDLSHRNIRVIQINSGKHGLKLGKYAKKAIPDGSFYSDEPHANQDLKKVLKEVKKELGIQFVNSALPEDKSFLFKVSLPKMPENEIRGVLELQLEEHVPLSGAEAVFDYSLIRKKNQDSDQMEAVVCAFPRPVIESFIELYRSAGLTPISFHIGVEAVARALIKPKDLGTYMIVNFGTAHTGIGIITDGFVQFTSMLNFGGQALTTAIEKQFSLNTADAEKVKQGKQILKNKQSMELFFSLMNPISALKDEINRLLLYWKNYRGQTEKTIEKIILCGSDSTLPGIDEYLGISLKMPVEVGNVWTNVIDINKELPPLHRTESLSYAGAIGLAIPKNNA